MENNRNNVGSGKAVAGFVLGICGIVCWILPIIGLPVAITGLVLSSKGKGSSNDSLANAGFVLNIIFLVLTIINSIVGILMFM